MTVWAENLSVLCDQVTDIREFERKEDVRAMFLFALFMVNFLGSKGYEYRGHNIKYLGWQSLLVVKASAGDTPLVAFVNERTPISCMRVFCRKFEEDRVSWQADKFA